MRSTTTNSTRLRARGGGVGGGSRRHRARLARDRPRGRHRPALSTVRDPRDPCHRRRTGLEHARSPRRTSARDPDHGWDCRVDPARRCVRRRGRCGQRVPSFRPPSCIRGICRVLRPKGSLALFWAWMLEEQFLRDPWMQEVDAVVEATRASSAIATAYRTWKEPPESAAGFSPFERREFPATHTVASARVADLTRPRATWRLCRWRGGRRCSMNPQSSRADSPRC